MFERAPYILSFLTLPMLAGMSMFVLVRRPRQPVTWCFVGVMTGLIIFYLADVALYQPDLSVLAGLLWQYIGNHGANITILAALALNILLRDKRLDWWEWAITVFVVVRMVIDSVWLTGLLRADLPRSCLIPQGLPKLTCPPGDRLAIVTGALVAVMVGTLYVSTAFKAAEPRRSILRRYVVWIVLLIVAGSLSLHALTLLEYFEFGVTPGAPLTLLATVVGLRLFLAFEEEETGVQLSVVGRFILVWLAALIVAVVLDVNWAWLGAPVWTFIVLAIGLAGGIAYLVTTLTQGASAPGGDEISRRPADSPPPSAPESGQNATTTVPPLQIHLLGPMRVIRDGNTLPNSSEVWRSAKTRSLLAYLALRGPRGATQAEIVDALWPIRGELSGESERQSLAAFRSYLSTLRRVLEPGGPRGSDRYVELADGRYRLRADSGVRVDIWDFEALVGQAEKHRVAGEQTAATACWEQAAALCSAEGLLPDEEHLLPEFLEPLREQLRLRWLDCLRQLARVGDQSGLDEQAAEWWERLFEAEPRDEEAYVWLREYYARCHRPGLASILRQRRETSASFAG